MQEKGRALPKFGEWDVNNPSSAEGFTVIFNKARNEKKAGGKVELPVTNAPSHKQDDALGKPSPPVSSNPCFCLICIAFTDIIPLLFRFTGVFPRMLITFFEYHVEFCVYADLTIKNGCAVYKLKMIEMALMVQQASQAPFQMNQKTVAKYIRNASILFNCRFELSLL
ncbi:hypothetical protein GQ457_05G004520 [Hibiscus cannabinus]